VGSVIRVGELLRDWRERRGLSQLRLAQAVDVSTRHLSFIETGRSHPSRAMLLRLVAPLDLRLRERNRLLLAAGYAPLFEDRPVETGGSDAVLATLDRFLRTHEPYPAVILDRHLNLIAANAGVGLLTEGTAPELLEAPANALRVALHPDGMAPRIANLGEWSAHLLARLRRQCASTNDIELERLYEELVSYPGVVPSAVHDELAGRDVLALRLRNRVGELAFFTTTTTICAALEVTLSEVTIEAFYPADAATASALRRED
jgi:transcriptional regulator with XRE-family HTH domain